VAHVNGICESYKATGVTPEKRCAGPPACMCLSFQVLYVDIYVTHLLFVLMALGTHHHDKSCGAISIRMGDSSGSNLLAKMLATSWSGKNIIRSVHEQQCIPLKDWQKPVRE